MGDAPFRPTLSRERVAEAGGSSMEEIIALNDRRLGLEKYREALVRGINPDVKVIALDAGLNDPPYIKTILELFDEMMETQSRL